MREAAPAAGSEKVRGIASLLAREWQRVNERLRAKSSAWRFSGHCCQSVAEHYNRYANIADRSSSKAVLYIFGRLSFFPLYCARTAVLVVARCATRPRSGLHVHAGSPSFAPHRANALSTSREVGVGYQARLYISLVCGMIAASTWYQNID